MPLAFKKLTFEFQTVIEKQKQVMFQKKKFKLTETFDPSRSLNHFAMTFEACNKKNLQKMFDC